MNLVKVISTSLGTLNKRVIKVLRFGKSDIQTSEQAASFGIDSNPIKDLIAICSETSEKGKTVIIGYLNKECLAAIGETRLFSTDANGTLKSYAWLKNDGTIHLNGSANNLVRYTALNTALQAEKNLINAELVKLGAAINAIIPGSYVHVPVTVDISASKIDDLKST